MTTRSSPEQSNPSDIVFGEPAPVGEPPPSAAALVGTAPVGEPAPATALVGEPPTGTTPAVGTASAMGAALGSDPSALLGSAHPLDDTAPQRPAAPDPGAGGSVPDSAFLDPVGDLVHAAVSDRPLEEIVRLVTLMEQSPEYAQTVGAVLRAVALDRPVEDVARLVVELTRPPREADSADETIRVAVERRCLEDVSRLMALLHQASLQPHCGQEAVRAAATGRPIEELVELIGRLAQERQCEAEAAADVRPLAEGTPETAFAQAAMPAPDSEVARPRARRHLRIRRARPPAQPKRPVFWPSWLAAAALVVCGAAYFPLRRDGAPLSVFAVTLGMSGLCLTLAVVLALRTSVAALMTGMLLPAGLAGAGLLESRVHSAGLSQAMHLTVAPPWSAGLTAVSASLASLAALLLLLMVQVAERYPAVHPTAEASRAAE
ncbi:hypothetical protein SSP24_01280 [Streptomyces spinoverrucosus]|uniref:Uncharacterized protein n=1 Tax=Streptomyces spinoverrucosus TaxID=284043 RepID=A0A4Y3V815_9ACTN|nr:hypothetical protein [Streptomyces spinoverrucosus]GEC02473.1 hypothetical protein SSP24_01280 [Streptomyces spinoverrucosus]GHB42759.1 hypothetical protein GCM10010397_11310 [Streptomyces spinoverrucosus]